MQENEIKSLVEKQRAYFLSGKTLDVNTRIEYLKKLRDCLDGMEEEINAALKEDLGKSRMESYMCEVGMTRAELSHMIRHTRSYAKNKTVLTPLAQFHAHSFVKPSPYGVALIMSPWNYPLMLSLEPLTDAIAAGNTVILKPSAYSHATSRMLEKIVKAVFPEELAAVVTGGRQENQALLNQKFDYIFFTGSQAVGKEVMRKAAEHLTPVTLELGGKSPTIVDKSANIALAAKRIVFGKYLNCGQTCVAPDYVMVHKDVHDAFIEAVKKEITKQFTDKPLDNPDYGKMVNQKHFDRVMGLTKSGRCIVGGTGNDASLQIVPTVLDDVTWNDAVMGEEIFGPVMPVLTFSTTDEVIQVVNDHQHPLALYCFASDKAFIDRVLSETSFGGGCVNDTIIHLATSNMGFGGVGESGMGSYHGKTGFDTFSHHKSIVDKKTWLDLPMRYQPYSGLMEKMVRMFLK